MNEKHTTHPSPSGDIFQQVASRVSSTECAAKRDCLKHVSRMFITLANEGMAFRGDRDKKAATNHEDLFELFSLISNIFARLQRNFLAYQKI